MCNFPPETAEWQSAMAFQQLFRVCCLFWNISCILRVDIISSGKEYQGDKISRRFHMFKEQMVLGAITNNLFLKGTMYRNLELTLGSQKW